MVCGWALSCVDIRAGAAPVRLAVAGSKKSKLQIATRVTVPEVRYDPGPTCHSGPASCECELCECDGS